MKKKVKGKFYTRLLALVMVCLMVVTNFPASVFYGTSRVNAVGEGNTYTIEGQVTDGTNPIGDAAVVITDGTGEPVAGSTDASGNYSISVNTASDKLTVNASKDGYTTESVEITIDPDVHNYTAGTISLGKLQGNTVSGTVKNANGNVSGAEVEVKDAKGNSLGTTTSSTTGTYTLSFESAVGVVNIYISKQDYRTQSDTITIENGATSYQKEFTLVPVQTNTISGKVTVANIAVSGADIVVKDAQENQIDATTSSDDGSYTLSFKADSGTFTVNVSKSGYNANSKAITVALDTTTYNGDILLDDIKNRKVSGKIMDGSTPVAGASIEVKDALSKSLGTAVSKDDGSYNISFTADSGTYAISASKAEYRAYSGQITIEPGTTDYPWNIQLQPIQNNAITGKITDKANSKAISGASVEIKDAANKLIGTATTLSDGTYTFSIRADEGVFTISALQYPYKENLTNISIILGQTSYTGNIELSMYQSNTISGRIMRANRNWGLQATVEIKDETGKTVKTTGSNNGYYTLSSVYADSGTYTIIAYLSDFTTEKTTVIISKEKYSYTVDTIYLTPAQQVVISGKVLEGTNAVSGATVELTDGSYVFDTTTTSADGTYSFSQYSNDDTFIIKASKSGYIANSTSVTIINKTVSYNNRNINLKYAVTSIVVNGPSNTSFYYPGRTYQFTTVVSPDNATDKTVKFTCTGSDFVTISADGLLSVGNDTPDNTDIVITASAQDGSNIRGTKTIKVTHQTVPTAGTDYTITGNRLNDTWYSGTVTITPAGDYEKILDGIQWADTYVVQKTGKNQVITALMDSDTTAESAEIKLDINIDNTDPVISIPTFDYNDENWRTSKNAFFTVTSDYLQKVYWAETADADDGTTLTATDGIYTFSVKSKGTYYVYAVDESGRKSCQPVDMRYVDGIAPTIGEITKNPDVTWAKSDVTVSIPASDSGGSGLVGVKYSKINDFASAVDCNLSDQNKYTFTVPSDMDSKNTYYIWAYDKTGNRTQYDMRDVGIDTNVPKVKINFEKSTPPLGKFLNFITFGFFANGTTDVTITAEDYISGVESITYYAVDEVTGSIVKPERSVDNIGSDKYKQEVKFTLDPNFKGFVYAKAKDIAGNEDNEYKNSASAVIVNDSDSNKLPVISISPRTEPNSRGFYNSDVAVDLSVTDTYAGINNIQYYITSQGKETYRNSTGDLNASKTEMTTSWRTPEDAPLIINAAANNSNDVEVKVVAEDNSGNIVTKSLYMKIDVTKPVITVDYRSDNSLEDNPLNGKYYNHGRTATISIVENNFDASDVVITVKKGPAGSTETDMVPSTGDWKANEIGNVHTATIDFNEDGEYFLDVSYTDLADNTGNSIDTQNFVIDTKAPKVNLSYDNNSDTTTPGFYNGDRNATISIDELNFKAADIKVKVTKKEDDQYSVDLSKDTDWTSAVTSDGIIHEAHIPFITDGSYTVELSYSDMAGNSGNIIENQSFVIDKTAPQVSVVYSNNEELNVKGVKNYRDKRLATITIKEKNFNEQGVSITVKKDGAQADMAPKTWKDNGDYSYTAEILYEKDADYEFSISCIDKAGNKNDGPADEEFVVDASAPVINQGDITFQPVTESEDVWHKLFDFISFKYFTNDDIKVTITASENTSNIMSISYYAVDETRGKISEGTADFQGTSKVESTTITLSPDFKGHVYAKSKNAAGVEMAEYIESVGAVAENKSTGAPKISIEELDPPNEHNFHNSDVPVRISVSDSYAGVYSVEYTIGSGGQKQTVLVGKNDQGELSPLWDRDIVVSAAENNSNVVPIIVTAVDNSGNKTVFEKDLAIDVTAPVLSVEYDNNHPVNDIYYKENRTGTIKIDELNFNPSDVKVIVKKNGTEQKEMEPPADSWKLEDPEDPHCITHIAHILYESDGEYTFEASYTDMAGNKGNSISTSKFIIDKTSPVITVNYDNISAANGEYYKDIRTATIIIREANFDASKVNMSILKDTVPQENMIPSANSWSRQGDLNTVTIPYDTDGAYSFDISYTDEAGNPGNIIATNSFIIDRTAPLIKPEDITFTKKNTGAFERFMNFITFKNFFNEETSVSIRAVDDISGIASITYYATKEDGITKVGSEQTVQFSSFDKERTINFTLKPDFKGFVFARACNAAGVEMAQYTQSVGVIVEDKSTSSSLPVIEIAPKTQPNSNGFYNGDVKVDLKVTDNYSGINNIKYTVGSGAEQTYTAPNSGSDELTPAWSREVTVPAAANNNNNVVITVTAEDNSGNITTSKYDMKIDVTAPGIDVKYNNNNAVNTKYYRADRTATITIDEMNFNPADVNITVKKNGAVQANMKPVASSWHRAGNINTASIVYDSDGDYTFDISYTDMAGNAGNSIPAQSFVIDKTLPVIAVSYDNNSVQNGNYYKAGRNATITVTEVNFKAEDMKVSMTADNNGSAVQLPGVGRWVDGANNTHTAAISFTADARFSLDIAYTDLAGNNAPTFAAQTFYVDKTNPSLTINGVKDLSANRNPIAPLISYSDTNIDSSRIQISLKGSNTGSAALKGQKGESASGGSLKLDELQIDDNYVLSAVIYDKAGNSTTQSVSFSVNKNGPTYSFEQKDTVEGKYVNNPVRPSIRISDVDDVNIVSLTLNGKAVDYTFENGVLTLKDDIKEDGKYIIALVTKDAAGNTVPMNDIEFFFDGTKPRNAISGVDNDGIYFDTVKVNIIPEKPDDRIETIRLNDRELSESEYTRNPDGTITLTLTDFKSYKLQVQTVDAAGNISDMTEVKFQITNNLFIKIYENKPLFYGIVTGLSVVVLGVICFFMFFRKKGRVAVR